MSEKTPRDILAAWRDLERQQEQADPEGAEFAGLELDIARLRSEYHRVTSLNVATTDQLQAASRESYRRVDISSAIVAQSRAMLREVRQSGERRRKKDQG